MLDTVITNWSVLHKLSTSFVTQINFVCIFGETGNEVVIVLKDDTVYAFGYNENGCLGCGLDCAILEPMRVEELCDKVIVDMSCGYSHAIAVTKHGNCYSWGNNRDAQLGNGTQVNCNTPHKICALNGKRVTAVCCGFGHSLALTQSGQVYAWGFNNCGQVGNGNNNNQLTPIRLNMFTGQRVIAISCGRLHSLALTDCGHVYSWGSNANGKLGIGNNNNQNMPIRVDVMSDVFVTRIACGSDHSLLLSQDCDLYSFGFNNCGQLGNGNKSDQNIPIKISANKNKFVDIASGFYSNMSVAVTQSGNCFIWGECDKEMITSPRETPIESIHDIFAVYSKRKISYRPIYFVDKPHSSRVVDSITKSFDDPKYSDLKFKIDGKYIHVHKSILKICCAHFETMLSEKWLDCSVNEIEITQYSYSVYHSFLKYLYTDAIDVRPEQAIDLYDLANSYLEDGLKQRCIKIIKTGISVDNFCALYSASIKHSIKDLEEYCVEFAYNNLWDIVNTDQFVNSFDSDLAKKLFISAAAKHDNYKN